MKQGQKLKIYLLTGAFLGGLLSITIAFLMDMLFSDALQGTWMAAISNDLNRCFSLQTTPESFIVYVAFGFILLILFLIGALLGGLFSLLLYRFFQFLSSQEH